MTNRHIKSKVDLCIVTDVKLMYGMCCFSSPKFEGFQSASQTRLEVSRALRNRCMEIFVSEGGRPRSPWGRPQKAAASSQNVLFGSATRIPWDFLAFGGFCLIVLGFWLVLLDWFPSFTRTSRAASRSENRQASSDIFGIRAAGFSFPFYQSNP